MGNNNPKTLLDKIWETHVVHEEDSQPVSYTHLTLPTTPYV